MRTGIWPLKEYVDGRVTDTRLPHPRLPVEDYLAAQGRFRHLFQPQRSETVLAAIQDHVERYWAAVPA